MSRPKSVSNKHTKKSDANSVRVMRENLLMSKSELAKIAGLSVLTLNRVERGEECRMSTKRKIIKALGLSVADKEKVFGSGGG